MPTSLLLEYRQDTTMPNKCSEIGFWSPVKCPVFFSDVLQNVLYFFSDCWDRRYTVTYWLSEYWCSVVALTFSVIAYVRSVFSTLLGRWQQWCSCSLSVLQQLVNDEPQVHWRKPYVVELFCRRSTMSRCILLTLQFATTPKRRMIHTLPHLKSSVPKRSGNLHAI